MYSVLSGGGLGSLARQYYGCAHRMVEMGRRDCTSAVMMPLVRCGPDDSRQAGGREPPGGSGGSKGLVPQLPDSWKGVKLFVFLYYKIQAAFCSM